MDRRTSFLREPIEAPLAKSLDTVAHYRTIFVSDMYLGTRGCQAACGVVPLGIGASQLDVERGQPLGRRGARPPELNLVGAELP